MACLLDWFFKVSGDKQETSNDDLARIINRLWKNDQFENDNSDLTPDELQAEERFKNTFSQGPDGSLVVGVAWRNGEHPVLPPNYHQAKQRYLKHHRRMCRKEVAEGTKSFFDAELQALEDAGYIEKVLLYQLSPWD